MKVAIVKPSGVCNGGTTTLCLQYAKLGFDVYFGTFKNHNYRHTIALDSNVVIYDGVDKLISFIESYDRILIVDIWIDKKSMSTALLDEVLEIYRRLPNIEICHVYAYRETKIYNEITSYFNQHDFKFTHTFTLNPALATDENVTVMDINAMFMQETAPTKFVRQNIILSAGKLESYKGALRFLKSANKEFFTDLPNFAYVHEGAVFSFHRSDNGISCPINTLSLFNTTVHPKVPKDGFIFKRYGESPDVNMFNIYPSYSVDDIQNRWSSYYVGICYLFGTKTGFIKPSLLNDAVFIIDPKERKRLLATMDGWNNSIEYADLEKIIFGLPVLFSRSYSTLIDFYDDRLIYNNFFEIPKKISLLQNYYENARCEQYNWLHNKVTNANIKIKNEFTRTLL